MQVTATVFIYESSCFYDWLFGSIVNLLYTYWDDVTVVFRRAFFTPTEIRAPALRRNWSSFRQPNSRERQCTRSKWYAILALSGVWLSETWPISSKCLPWHAKKSCNQKHDSGNGCLWFLECGNHKQPFLGSCFWLCDFLACHGRSETDKFLCFILYLTNIWLQKPWASSSATPLTLIEWNTRYLIAVNNIILEVLV